MPPDPKGRVVLADAVQAPTREDTSSFTSSCSSSAESMNGLPQKQQLRLDDAEPSSNNVFIGEGLEIPVFAIDMNGCVTGWNERMTELTELPSTEVLHRPVTSLISSDDSNPIQLQSWREASSECLLEGSRERTCEVDLCCKSGISRFRIKITCQRAPCRDDVVGAVCFVEPISATLIDGACSQTVDLGRLVADANLPIFCVDVSGNVNLWNRKMAEICEISETEAMGQCMFRDFPLPSLQESLKGPMVAALTGNDTTNFELEVRPKSGAVRYLLTNVSARRGDDDSVVGAVVMAQDVTRSAQYERAVASMAQEFRQLLDTASAPIIGIDDTGKVNEWNDKAAEITGYSPDEAFNKPFLETFIAPDHRSSVQGVIKSALKGQGTTNYELQICTRANQTRYLLVDGNTRRDAENNIVGVVAIAQDVTEASKHDRAVASMASELRQLIDTANAPIFGIDCEGDVNEWNDKTTELSGHSKEDAFDCSLVETFIAPHMQASVQDVLNNALQGRGTSNFELEFLTKSSETRHLLVNATTRRNAENHVVGVVCVAQDVTESSQRDRAVAGMAVELRQLIDTANAPIFGIDVDGNVNEWNRRTQDITGYSKEDTFDESLVDKFIAPHMRQKVQEILDAALQGYETSNYELEFVAKSGEPRFMLVNATTRRDPEFNIVGVVGVAQDVTEDRKHAAELRRMQYLQATQEAKVETERNMTAYFAHELRNPLGAIDSALMSMPEDISEEAKQLVSGMQLCSSFMSSIMNNLLDVRKMEEGKMTLTRVPISLSDLLDDVFRMLLPAVKPGVSFIQKSETEGKNWVLGDKHRIQQVMTNVITNAIKYTSTGSITIKFSWDGDVVKFECIDTGPGIPKSVQEKLFERFVQRGGAPGTGLGLAIAKHIVDLTGGSMIFDSDPTVRAGTNCIVRLSLTRMETPSTPATVTEDVRPLEAALRFLIVDDIKMNRMMLKRRILKGVAPNCHITEACNGEEALEISGAEKFDIIIVDQYMEEAGGVMVGTDVVYAMRRMRIDSIIIGCSGNDLDQEFADAGTDWVWQKPMPSNQEIIVRLREELAKRPPCSE